MFAPTRPLPTILRVYNERKDYFTGRRFLGWGGERVSGGGKKSEEIKIEMEMSYLLYVRSAHSRLPSPKKKRSTKVKLK